MWKGENENYVLKLKVKCLEEHYSCYKNDIPFCNKTFLLKLLVHKIINISLLYNIVS